MSIKELIEELDEIDETEGEYEVDGHLIFKRKLAGQGVSIIFDGLSEPSAQR